MTLLPVSMGVASAANNGNNGNGNGNNGQGNGNGNGNQGHNCPNPAGHYPPGQCKGTTASQSQAKPGEQMEVESDGNAPGSNTSFTMHSTPVFLSNAIADVNGIARATVTIPCDAAPGQHTIESDGVFVDGTPNVSSVVVTVLSAPCVLGEQVTNPQQTGTQTATQSGSQPAASTAGTSSTLPFTGGAATTLLVTVALALIAAGSVAVTAARRRRVV